MGRRNLLTEEERDQFFLVSVNEANLIKHYTLSPDDLEKALAKRGARNQLGFALQLCLLRYPGFGLRIDEPVPQDLLDYLAHQLSVRSEVFRDYSRRHQTRLDHAGELAEFFGLRAFTPGDFRAAVDIAAQAARGADKGAPIVTAILDGLRSAKIVLPSPETIERVGLAGRAKARKQAADALVVGLVPAQIAAIDALLTNDHNLGSSRLAWLRDMPESPSAGNMNELLERLAYVRALELDANAANAIHGHRFQQMVREGAAAPAFLLSDYGPRRRRAILVAQMLDLEVRLSDGALAMFDKLIGSLFARARKRQERRYQATTHDVARLMRLFDRTIGALTEAREQDADLSAAIDEEIGWNELLEIKPEVEALANFAEEDPLVTATEKYMTLRKYAPAFLEAFEFMASGPKDPMLRAIKILRKLNEKRRGDVPDAAPMPFANKKWKRLVTEMGKPDRRLYETAVLTTLRDRLRSGDIWVAGTRNYQRFDDYLLPSADVAEKAADLAITTDVDTYLSGRAKLLDWRLRRFARMLNRGKVEGVELSNGKLRVTPLKAITPPQADRLDRIIDDLLPRIRITELLADVDRRTGFAAHFTDLRSGRGHDNPNAVLAAILADATNLGIERMADASKGVTYPQLAWTHNWYLSDDNYAAALTSIIDAHHGHPFAEIWGDGTASSSDGQYFPSGRSGGGQSEINAKYGSEPGVRFYTHVSDQYGSFHIKVISATNAEAPHVLDGLMHHGASLDIKEHFTDTGGVSHHVFALCHLLGYRFVPRIRDLQDRRLGTIEAPGRYEGLVPLMGRPIRTDIIRECWDEIIRLGASVKAGVVAPSVMLKKLSAFKRQNRLDLALQEIGRIERTLFTLDWLESADLRRRCQAGLNKGESRHFLARAIYAHKQGRVTDRTFANQNFRASGLNLVIAAIVYWNTLYMERAVEHLRTNSIDAPDDLLAHVAPLGWSHISLTGDYLWDQSTLIPDEFRPLRLPGSRLQTAA
ncbi:MAG: Tn3 family transposase [Methylocella sp.]